MPDQDAILLAERGLCGAILDSTAGQSALTLAEPLALADLRDGRHREILAAARALRTDGKPTDIFAVAMYARTTGRLDAMGGTGYLDALLAASPTSAHAEWFATELVKAANKRRAIATLQDAAKRIVEGDADGALEDAAAALDRVKAGRKTDVDLERLGDLVRHQRQHDPNELVRDRFLCRGGGCLLVGPTGVGKSSLSMQVLLSFAAGLPAFGLWPAKAMRVLLVQAENDAGDLAEMRDGVLAGLQWPPELASTALENVRVLTEDAKTGQAFAALLDRALAEWPCDLVVIDPAFAYLGGDASSQRDVSPFLRNMLNPIIHRHNVGLILVHHANKPRTGEQKSQWQAGDFAYLGAGTAEWANWARAVLAIRSVGSHDVFELVAAKRGYRLGWEDVSGGRTTVKGIAHDTESGRICWREASLAEVEAIKASEDAAKKPKGITAQQIVDAIGNGELGYSDLVTRLMVSTGLKDRACRNAIDQALAPPSGGGTPAIRVDRVEKAVGGRTSMRIIKAHGLRPTGKAA